MKALSILQELKKGYSIHKNDVDDAIEELEALQRPNKCYDCRDKYECHIYRTLDEDATYILSCPYFEPKGKE